MRNDVGACDRTRGLYGHRKNLHWEKNPLPHWGLEPTSVLRLAFRSDALPTDTMLFQTTRDDGEKEEAQNAASEEAKNILL